MPSIYSESAPKSRSKAAAHTAIPKTNNTGQLLKTMYVEKEFTRGKHFFPFATLFSEASIIILYFNRELIYLILCERYKTNQL